MKMRPLSFAIFLCFIVSQPHYLFAQNRKIDSLRRVLKTEKEDSNKAKTLLQLLCAYNYGGKPDSALYYGNQAFAASKKINFPYGIVMSYIRLGSVYFNMGDFAKMLELLNQAKQYAEEIHNKSYLAKAYTELGFAYQQKGDFGNGLKYLNQALDIAKTLSEKPLLSSIYYDLANLYIQQGDYPRALDYGLKALKVDEDLGNKEDIATDLCSIASLYISEGDLAQGKDNFEKGLKIYTEVGDRTGILRCIGNLAIVYHRMKDEDKSLEYDFKALALAKELNAKYIMANAYTSMTSAYIEKKEYDSALFYTYKAIDLCKEIGEKNSLARNYNNLGDIYYQQKNYKKSEMYTLLSLSIGDSLKLLDMIKLDNENLSRLYAETGQWQKAYEHYQLAVEAKDSLINEAKSKEIGKLEAKSDYDKQLTIQQAEDDKRTALAAAESKRQKALIGFVIAIALAVAIIAVIIFRALNVTRKQKVLIEQQKMLVEGKNKEILDSITYAKRLQNAILPPLSLIKQCLPESFVLYKPKDIVAGDFYWLEKVGDTILIAAADCTGHGVPGAMVSVVCSNALNRTVKEFKITEPGKILDKVRELVVETYEKSEDNVQDGMDISLASISYKLSANSFEVQWSGAYNSLWYIQNNSIKELPADKQPIGKTDNPTLFNTHNLNLQKGDALYLFTDGYADQFGGPKGKKFKYKQFQEKLLAISHQPLAEQKQELEQAFEDWMGNLEQVDDVLVIGIRV